MKFHARLQFVVNYKTSNYLETRAIKETKYLKRDKPDIF